MFRAEVLGVETFDFLTLLLTFEAAAVAKNRIYSGLDFSIFPTIRRINCSSCEKLAPNPNIKFLRTIERKSSVEPTKKQYDTNKRNKFPSIFITFRSIVADLGFKGMYDL